MTLHPKSVKPIPALTKEIAIQAFPKGNLYITMRDRLGTFYTDWDFTDLFPQKGQPAASPWRLALITGHGSNQGYKTKRDWRLEI